MQAQIVTCSKIITAHSLQSRQPIHSYTHHRGIVHSVSINHTNKVIASCGQDGKIFLVNAEKPQQKLLEKNFYPNLKEKPSALSSCAFSPNSRFMAVGSVDSIVKVWDLRGGDKEKDDKNITHIKSHMCGVTSLAWVKGLKNGEMGEVLASASSSGDIYLHANRMGVFQQTMAMKLQEGVNCVKISQGNDYCRMAACTNAGTLAVWDLLSGKDRPFWTTNAPNDARASMTSLSISSYSPVLLVTASMDQTLTFFDIHDKKSVKKITAQQPLTCVGLHSNGHTLVAGGMYGTCFGYDLRNPSKPQIKFAGHQSTIKSLEFYHKIKQRQPSGISSKPLSVSNSNSSIPPPPVADKKLPTSTVSTQLQSRNKEDNIKMMQAQTKMNNFMGSAAQKTTSFQQVPRQKKIQSKLSSTAQQLMRNQLKSQSIVSQHHQIQADLPPSNYRARTRQSRTQFHEHPIQTLSQPMNSLPSSSAPLELKQLKDTVHQLQKQLKQVHNQMYDMQERLNLSMIRQFQLHQNQMKNMMMELIGKQKEKDQVIRKLEMENQRLKKSTF